jgi:NAD(P)-dependent dehydrogenase (short-subunit alcohol dehydrogenase family)
MEANGTIAIVTGANRGLGRETALGLAKLGYTVVLACRNIGEADMAAAEISEIAHNSKVCAMRLDVGSCASVFAFVREFQARFGRVSILVNNAGVSKNTDEKTADGFEMNVGTNYLGTYALTMSLLPLFQGGPRDRIVNLTSNIYKMGKFKMDRIGSYRWVKAYAASKYMILLFTLWLSGRDEAKGIRVNAVHPGIVRTSIMYTHRWYDAIIKALLLPFFIDPAQGAKGIIELASAEQVENGRLYSKGGIVKVPARFSKESEQEELMRFSAEYLERKRKELEPM